MQKTAKAIIDHDINPFVDEWEASGQYPAKQVFKKLAEAGLLGVNKPVEYGGMGLNFKFSIALNETLGHIRCGAVPMSIAVQTDMATPALARFGSEYVKREFLQPSIAGEFVACLGVSEPGGGSDVAACQTTAKRDGDDKRLPGGLDVSPGQHTGRASPHEQIVDLPSNEHSRTPPSQTD